MNPSGLLLRIARGRAPLRPLQTVSRSAVSSTSRLRRTRPLRQSSPRLPSLTGAPQGIRLLSTMGTKEFHHIADLTLENIHDAVEGALEAEYKGDFDMHLSQGVLNVQVGEDSTWVINKQAPNLQIWWSSPVSGPKRYEYDANAGAWVNTRDGGRMDELVVKELRQACGADVGDRVARALADFAARPT